MATMTAASHVAKSACALARAGSRQQSTQQTGSLAALAPASCVVSERLRFGPLLLPASQVSPLPLTSSADSLCCLVHIHLPVAGALPGTAVPDLPTANALVQAGGAQTSSCKVMPQASSLSITQQGELCQRGLIEFPSISHLDSSSPVYYIHGSERLTSAQPPFRGCPLTCASLSPRLMSCNKFCSRCRLAPVPDWLLPFLCPPRPGFARSGTCVQTHLVHFISTPPHFHATPLLALCPRSSTTVAVR